MKKKLFFTIFVFLFLASCTSYQKNLCEISLSTQIDNSVKKFFKELIQHGGTVAQSYFTIFIPQDEINKRYLVSLKSTLEKSFRKYGEIASLYYNSSADRIFFLSKYKPEGWKSPNTPSEILAKEFRKGTRLGWTAFNTLWSQFNRLLIGNSKWIQTLPDSIRADLTHPLKYVIKIRISLESNPNIVTYNYLIDYILVEVGKERTIFAKTYPLCLSYNIK